MADASNLPQTPYAVAYQLAAAIAQAEGMPLSTKGADRQYTLALYRECLDVLAVRGATFSPR